MPKSLQQTIFKAINTQLNKTSQKKAITAAILTIRQYADIHQVSFSDCSMRAYEKYDEAHR